MTGKLSLEGGFRQDKLLFGLEGSDERKRERLLSDFEVDESDSKEEKGGEMRFMLCWAGGGGGVLEFVVNQPRNVLLVFVESLVNILMRL